MAKRPSFWLRYSVPLVASALVLVLKLLLEPVLADSPQLLLLATVMVSSWYGGWGPGLLAAALAGLSSAWYFLPVAAQPREFSGLMYLPPLGLFMGEALIVIALIEALRSSRRHILEEEERFHLLVEGVRDYAIFMISPEGHVVSWNVGAERINGYPTAEILGRHFSCLYPQEDVESGKPDRELEVAGQEGRCEVEGWRVRKDGARYWGNTVTTPLRDDAGRLRGFARMTRDMTERKRADEKIRTLNAELEQRVAERTRELQTALEGVKQLQGLLPICAWCKKVRDDQNYWHEVEGYVSAHSEVRFSHGICPQCFEKFGKSEPERSPSPRARGEE